MKTIITALLLMLCASAHARLGETVDECVKRYGVPTSYDEKSKTFFVKKSDIMITLKFNEGKCTTLSFYRMSKNGQPAPFSDAEVQVLLEANGEGWHKVPRLSINPMWSNKDDSRLAVNNPVEGGLIFMTMAQARADDAAKTAAAKAEAEKKLKGF